MLTEICFGHCSQFLGGSTSKFCYILVEIIYRNEILVNFTSNYLHLRTRAAVRRLNNEKSSKLNFARGMQKRGVHPKINLPLFSSMQQ